MNRRDFLCTSMAASTCVLIPPALVMAREVLPRRHEKLLILIELKGGNDGLNTVIPFADPAYLRLRPTIGIHREHVLQLDERTGIHPSMQSLMPIWRDGQLAIVQGMGYPRQNLSHFRSMEIWDTASRSDQYLRNGWLTRAFDTQAARASFAMTTSRFESLQAASPALETTFPDGPFGASIETAMSALARRDALSGQEMPVIRLTLSGFDTHQNQPVQHAALLKQLSEGLVAIRSSLTELGQWNNTLVMTYSEFGRRPRENESKGTDHGTAAPHFVMGGGVNGGLHGEAPALARLDGNGNLPVSVDFRQMYATVLGPWWGMDCGAILGGRFQTLPLLRARAA